MKIILIRVKKLINEGGGVYSGNFDVRLVTHLVANKPEGEKYKAAQSIEAKVIRLEWIEHCAKEGKWVDETPFLLESTERSVENSSFLSKSIATDMDQSTAASKEKSEEETKALLEKMKKEVIDKDQKDVIDNLAKQWVSKRASALKFGL